MAALFPPALNALLGWWKADAILGLANGDPVITWPDSSNLGPALTQATAAKRPTFRTAQLGGLPIVRFDGVNDNFVSAASFAGAGIFALTLVFKFNAFTGTLDHVFQHLRVAPLAYNEWSVTAANRMDLEVQRTLADQRLAPFVHLTTRYYAFHQDYNGTHASHLGFRHGQTLPPVDSVTNDPGSADFIGGLGVGSNFDGTADFVNIDLAEAIYWRRTLSNAERLVLSDYLATRYGAQIPNAFTDIIPIGATTRTGSSVGGPLSPIVVLKPTGAATNDVLIAHANLARNVGTNYVYTPPAGWVEIHNLQNGSIDYRAWFKVLLAGEPANYSWAVAPAPNQGGGITIDCYRGCYLSRPIYRQIAIAKGSGFLGDPAVTTVDWNITEPAAGPYAMTILRNASDGRTSNPTWTIPLEYITPDGQEFPPSGLDANDWSRRRGKGLGEARALTITAAPAAHGVQSAIVLASAAAPPVLGSKILRLRK